MCHMIINELGEFHDLPMLAHSLRIGILYPTTTSSATVPPHVETTTRIKNTKEIGLFGLFEGEG